MLFKENLSRYIIHLIGIILKKLRENIALYLELTKAPLAFDIPKVEDLTLEQMAICLQENFRDTSSEKYR